MPRNEAVEVVSGLLGVDLLPDATQIDPRRWRRLENFYPQRGSLKVHAKRLGSAKYNASAIAGASGIDNMIRAWNAAGTKRMLVAASKAVNDELHYGDDAAGTFTQITLGSALPTGAKWFFKNWPLLSECYAASGDGTVPIQIIASPYTTKADMVIGAGATDAKYGQFLELFFSRLVTARTPTNPNYVYYFNVANSGTIGATQFYRISEPVTALGKISFSTQSAALNEMLIVCGANSLWSVPGDPSVTGVTIQQASDQIGCKAPKTMRMTPLGLMFLGSDGMVYLIDVDPKLPQKVGLRVFPDLSAIPGNEHADACAVYHNGFYKLSFAPAGGTQNTQQYWFDLLPVLTGLGEIEVYGPMTNLSLRSFCLFDAPADSLTLRGGDDAAGTAWKLDQTASYVDGSTTIVGRAYTKEFDEGDPLRQKIWNGFTFGYLKSDSGTASVDAVTDSGAARYSGTLTWTQSGSLWDVFLWDVGLWAGAAFVEDAVNYSQRVIGRSAQLQVTHALATDWQLRDFGRKAKVIPRMI